MTPLARSIARRIGLEGPISLATFMAEALGNPQHGYYTTRDPLGRRGDFITAPEVSQMFGELIGLWCAETWRLMGQPDLFVLAELGPGRGTLMADAMRAGKVLPGFCEAARLHLVETSPALRAVQAETLDAYSATWHDDVGGLPDGPLIVIANEFFDALPVRQFEMTEDGWRERLVTAGGPDADGFHIILDSRPAAMSALFPDAMDTAEPGAVYEIAPAAVSIAASLAERIARDGGAAIVVDYGHAEHRIGATLQAVRGHARHDALADPGTADLTAHVDFAALGEAARHNAAVHGPITQRDLLLNLGLAQRAEQLCQRATPAQRARIESARHRLIDPSEMGTLFKALAISHSAMAVPPGFETATTP